SDVSLATILSSIITEILQNSSQKTSSNGLTSSGLIEIFEELTSATQYDNVQSRISEVLADTIWSFDLEIEAKKSFLEEQIKTVDFTLTNRTDSKLKHRRITLIELSISLLNYRGSSFMILDPQHCRLSWEYAFLHETGLLSFTADLVAKQSTRLNTGLHYKQQRFNLLREESEGYSHLATELISDMGPGQNVQLIPSESGDGEATSYPHLNSILNPGEPSCIQESRIEKVLNNVKALIGFFDLDPNRTLDIILDVFCYNVITHHQFFIALLKKSHWIKGSSCNIAHTDPGKVPIADGTLPVFQGSKLIASLLGFKFAHYQQADSTEAPPEELYLMTAILIWHKIINIRDILPHLSPDSQSIKQYEADWRLEISNKAANSGPKNALSLAGALDGSGSSAFSRTGGHAPSTAASNAPSKPKSTLNQRSGLLSALLSIGSLQESIYLISLPNHGFMLLKDPKQSYLLLRLIEVALSPVYVQSGLSVSKTANGLRRSATITRPKKKYAGGPGGVHQLVEPDLPRPGLSARVGPRLAQLTPSNPKIEPVFFWPNWRDRVRLAESSSEILDFVWPLLRFVGPFGYTHTRVFHKVAELTATAVQQRSESFHPDQRWNHLLRWFLLPALSMMQGCVAASNLVWRVLRNFSYEERYMIYGEWKERVYIRIPELKVERAKADAETKRVLKTMTLDNLKEKSRALAKLASSNPCIVFNAALNQVQTYDNLIACVVECLRYLNLFALDVLTYSIIEFLSNPDKDRSKSDGTNIAAWLQNLAKFVGNVFKRNLSLDPAVVLQYITNQLSAGNAKDLIILRDLISKMSGVDVLQDLSASQVVALGGSKTLRAEAISPTTLTGKKPSYSKSSNRLMRALSESGLTVPLMLLVASQRQNAVLLAEDSAHLKYLGVLADSCQQVLFQYIDFLRAQLASRNISDYENVLPSIEDMWSKHGIDPAIIFQVWRPVLSTYVRPNLKIGSEGEIIIENKSQSFVSDSAPAELLATQMNYPSSLSATVLIAQKMLPEATRKLVGPHFFVTFWQLDLYDIRMPDERYISETSRLNTMLSDLDREYAMPMISSLKEVNRSNRSKILEIRSTLTKEMKLHIKHYELARARLASEKSYWFPLSARSQFRAQLLEHIIQHCFNPRAKLSPVDAAYTAHFIKTLHGLGTASFMTLKLFDRIFSSDVGPTIFPCSEFEASNYGRFLRDLLLLVKSWYDSESVFKKTGLGKDKKGNYLPGLRMKWGKADNATEGISETDMLSFDNLQKVVKKWTAIVSSVCKDAIQSGEYMHIRNSIALLKELDGLVPLFEDQVGSLEAAVTDLLKREKREDVKVLAYGYKSMLKRAAKTVIKVKPIPPTSNKKPESTPGNAGAGNSDTQTPSKEPRIPLSSSSVPAKPMTATKINTPSIGSSPQVSASTLVADPRAGVQVLSTAPVRPAGLPERPIATATRLPPPVSRQDSDHSLPAPATLHPASNGSNVKTQDHSRQASLEGLRPQLPAAPVPSAEAAEREALARAAVQRSRKFGNTNIPSSAYPSQIPFSQKHNTQPAEEARNSAAYPANFPDRPYNSFGHPHSADQIQTSHSMHPFPSGPKATRPNNGHPGDGYPEEMRPPALPSAPKAENGRRDAHHPSSIVSSNATSPRVREEHLKRDDNAPLRQREDRRHGNDERDSYDRREERDYRRTREDPRTRYPSVESVRSIRSSRDKERRTERTTERTDKRKRSRSPSERHRDHRDRERDRDRDRDKEKEKDRDRKDREIRHREKDKDIGREDREKDRDRDREKRSHRREREKEDRRHDKDRDKEKERDKDRDPKNAIDLVIDDSGAKRRKTLFKGETKSNISSHHGLIPSGPRALQGNPNVNSGSQSPRDSPGTTSRDLRSRDQRNSSSNASPAQTRQHGADSWVSQPNSQTAKNGLEPKKNISIKGMAATALQKANEGNARRDRKEPEGIGSRAAPVDVELLVSGRKDSERELSNTNTVGLPTSLLSRMDDGKKHQDEVGPPHRPVRFGLIKLGMLIFIYIFIYSFVGLSIEKKAGGY
ncbi:transcription factor/nuclear export subunit protein 2-domain-containing protein, partial [Phakopsora pachyrhizi]